MTETVISTTGDTDLFLSLPVSNFSREELIALVRIRCPISGLASCDQGWDVEKVGKGSIVTNQQWLEDGMSYTWLL